MALRIPDRVVVFDYGEVISYSPDESDRAALLENVGVPAERFWPEYWREREQLDRGTLSVHDYWRRMGDRLGAVWSDARIQQIWIADFRGWLSVNPDVFDILAELHAGGTRLFLLSNAGFDYASYFRFAPMARYFERMFVSAELDMVKPHPAIYEAVLAEVGIPGERMIFIDNKEENVTAAELLGITGHVFVTAAELRAFLEPHAVAPGSGS